MINVEKSHSGHHFACITSTQINGQQVVMCCGGVVKGTYSFRVVYVQSQRSLCFWCPQLIQENPSSTVHKKCRLRKFRPRMTTDRQGCALGKWRMDDSRKAKTNTLELLECVMWFLCKFLEFNSTVILVSILGL